MHVGIVVKDFPPDMIGGMELQTKRMAAELQSRNHSVTVFTKSYNDHDDSDINYEVVRVWNLRWNPFISTLTFLVTCIIEIARRRSEIDILQCMMIYPVGFLGVIVEKLFSIPYFAWVRGGDYYLMRDVWWKRWMMRTVLADTLVVCQSEEIRADLRSDFPNINANINILGNGVEIPEERANGDAVLYVGRLAKKKGVEYLLKAMSLVDDGELVIVGNGSERKRLERLADELSIEAKFEGEVAHSNVRDYYKNAGVFVLPSIEGEGLPNALLEAMAWGIPVVATPSGGVPAIVDDGKTGYLIPMRDADAIAQRIDRLLGSPELRRTIGEAAREHVTERFSWDRLANKLEAIYEKVTT